MSDDEQESSLILQKKIMNLSQIKKIMCKEKTKLNFEIYEQFCLIIILLGQNHPLVIGYNSNI